MRHGSSSRRFVVFSVVVVNLVTNLFADVGSDEELPDWCILGMDVLANNIVDSKMVAVNSIVDSLAVLVVIVVVGACCECNF